MDKIKKLWNRWRRPKSLVGICISRLAVYVLFVIIVYQIFTSTTERLWSQTFPVIEDYVSYMTYLSRDEFYKVPADRFKNCGIMIYGDRGRVIYSSNQDIKAIVSYEELKYIPDMRDPFTYSVMEGEEGEIWIFKVDDESQDGEPRVEEFCHIDESHNVLEGSLLGETTKVSRRAIDFMKGVYSNNRTIMKYTYTNSADKERTLVFLSPQNTPQLMEEYFKQERLILALGMLGIILGAVITAFFIAKRVRLSILPLNELMEDYSVHKKISQNIEIPGELESIEQNFILLTDRLEASNLHRIQMEQEKNRMIADLSHDLKSPLTVINGYSQALASGKVMPEDVHKYLDVIRRKAATSVEMINNLMQYATMEHPDYHPTMELIDLSEFIRVCLINRYDELEEKGFDLELELPETEVQYNIDRRIMGSVMENLINNSIRYNDPGTMVFVSLEEKEDGITVTFADTGVGIPEEIRKDLFKPFVIGNQARTSTKGTGIGMSIIRRGVEMHGGNIKLLESKGTSFSTIFEMYFPKQKEEK